MTDPLPREFPSRPLVAVGAVVFNDLLEVLLVRRANEPKKGDWSLPGGSLELGETLVSAVEREVAEETGVVARPQTIVEVIERIYIQNESSSESQPGRVRFHYVIVDYWCWAIGGELRAASDACDAVWASREQWQEAGCYGQDSLAVEVIEKSLLMAQAAKIDG